MKYEQLTEKKKRLDGFRPLPDVLVRNLDDWFRVELTYTSNAIEGNTLTRSETALVVEKGITAGGGKTLVEHLEAVNHARAVDWTKEQAGRRPQSLAEKDILQIHDIVLNGIDEFNRGRYRSVPARISGSPVVLPNPRKVPDLMAGFAEWLGTDHKLHPVELAAEAHYRLVSIHPFADGNGRTARLLMNTILLMTGYPPAIIRRRDRSAYIDSLEKAQTGGSKDDYMEIIAKAAERSLDIFLEAAAGEDKTSLKSQTLLKIGELARRADESSSTIRHWTKKGLLEVAELSPGGFHLYSADMVERARHIQELKERRLTLREIGDRFRRRRQQEER